MPPADMKPISPSVPSTQSLFEPPKSIALTIALLTFETWISGLGHRAHGAFGSILTPSISIVWLLIFFPFYKSRRAEVYQRPQRRQQHGCCNYKRGRGQRPRPGHERHN